MKVLGNETVDVSQGQRLKVVGSGVVEEEDYIEERRERCGQREGRPVRWG